MITQIKVHNSVFKVTEEGYYKSAGANQHNYFMNGYGTVWEAEIKVPALEAQQGMGFVLHQRNANGGIEWGKWMQIILWKPATGNIQLQANILNETYKTDTLSVASMEGKTLRVSLLNSRIYVAIDDEVIAIYDSSTVMENTIHTVDGVLGLSGTNGVYCGLVAKQADTVITDWNFSNVFEAETVCATSLNYQGGAIYNNNAFVMNNNGTYRVMDLSTGECSSEYTLDKVDVIKPHANSVCFSDTFYPGDSKDNGDYPLLYVNVYNNYRGQDEEHEGTCLVYRVQESEDGTFTTTLVQVVVIGFAKSDVENIWKSAADIEQAGTTAVRPFGNFVVDTDNDMLYAYTLRSTEQCMRFFKFNLPEVQEVTETSSNDANYNATYGCYVVTLQESDIVNFKDDVQYFDVAGYPVIQDATYYQGRLILNDGSSAGTDSCIRVIDPETGKEEYTLDVDSLFPDLVKEAEMISINPEDGSLYYMTTPGTLRKLKLPLVWEVEQKTTWEDGTLATANAAQSSATNRECTKEFLRLDDYRKITFGPTTQKVGYLIFVYDKEQKYLGRYWSNNSSNSWVDIASGESHTLLIDTIKTKYNGTSATVVGSGDPVYFRIVIKDYSLEQGPTNTVDIGNDVAKVKLWTIAKIKE